MQLLPIELIVAAALPLTAGFLTAEQVAANDDATCRNAGRETGNPAYARCRAARDRVRLSQRLADQALQWQMWEPQEMSTREMSRPRT